MTQYTIEQFKKDLDNPYAWPGGYPRYFVMADGEPMSFEYAKENADRMCEEISNPSMSDKSWTIIGCEINYEDNDLYCCGNNEKIESAYGND